MYTLSKFESYKPVIGITLDTKHNKSIEGPEGPEKRRKESDQFRVLSPLVQRT